jgi:hypothetical protein
LASRYGGEPCLPTLNMASGIAHSSISLGFRGLIDGLGKGALSVEEMRDLLTIIHKPDGLSTRFWPTDFRTQSISDAVAISANMNREGLIEILRALEILTLRLLDKGYFIRGGLVKGRLFHDENVVFGDALVEAFRLESEVARYHRRQSLAASDVGVAVTQELLI